MPVRFTLAGLVAGSLLSTPVLAETLEPVIVSATRSAQSEVSIPGSISIISQQDIRDSGATSLAEVLRGQGAVQVRDIYGDGTRMEVGMRGFGSTAAANTLVLIDGRRLNNPDLAAPEFSSIHLKDIERIEIIQGSAGTLFGDQAVGGVINIITRSPQQFHATVAAEAGSYGRRSINASVSNRLDNGVSFRLSAVSRDADNYRGRNEVGYGNLLGRMDYGFARGNVFVEYQTVNEDAHLPGGLFAADFAVDRRAPRYLTDYADTDTDSARIGLQYDLADNWQFAAELTRRDTDVNGRLSGFDFTQARTVEEFTPRLVGTLGMQHGEALLTLGLDYIRSDYLLTAFGTTTNDQTVRNLYAQAVMPLTERLSLTLGARGADVENDLTDSFKFASGINIDDSQSVYEAGVSMRVNPQWRVFARRDGNFRFAKLDEHTQTLGGVVALDTQTGVSYEFGSEWRRDGNSIKATLFRLTLENEIDYDPVNFANINLDPTVRNGLVLEGKWQASDRLQLSGQYSYIDASFDKGAFKGNAVPFVAENTAHLAATYQLDPNWTVFGEMQYIGDRFAAGDLTNAFAELDGYTVYNLNINYVRKNWQATLRINNLTDKQYSDYATTAYNPAIPPFGATDIAFYAAPERNLALTLQYSY